MQVHEMVHPSVNETYIINSIFNCTQVFDIYIPRPHPKKGLEWAFDIEREYIELEKIWSWRIWLIDPQPSIPMCHAELYLNPNPSSNSSLHKYFFNMNFCLYGKFPLFCSLSEVPFCVLPDVMTLPFLSCIFHCYILKEIFLMNEFIFHWKIPRCII